MPNWKKLLSSGSSGSLAHLSVDTSVNATSFTGSLLRLDENGTGLRLTNVGAFDNSSGDFRIFANQNLIISTNGDNGTAVTFDQTTKDANFVGAVTASAFKGDGSQLTGITADGTISGSSQVDITQTNGYSTFSSSIQTYTDAKVAGLVDAAPGTLDTLNELAAALGDDATFSASIATSIGNRVLTSTFNTYSGSAAGALRTEYNAGDTALSSSAHTQRVAIASSIPTNNNQLTNGAGYITSFDITTQTDSKYLRSDTSDTMAGVLTLSSTNDNQLKLSSSNTWTGIGFDDGDAASVDYLWHYGATGTFALGGGGSSTAGKKLHVDGAVSIGSNSDATSVPTDGLHVEGAVVLKGQHTFEASRDSYWDYNDKVALQIMPAADDGAVAILFPSIGNSTSDFAYIAYDEDYGEAGVDPGENGALILGCENDGGGSSDHVRVKGRLVVEADISSSDPTYALQVKSSNTTSDLFNVARAGGGYLSGTFNVTGDVVAYYSSDERLKDNLVPIGNASEKVKQLTGYEFDWNDKQDVYEGHDIGVVAQEVEKVLPEVVTTRDNGYKAVKYEKLVALLIQSNKELIERVELLEKQLNAK